MSLAIAPELPRRPRPRSLAWRLTAWYAGSAFLLIAAATAFLYWALVMNLEREDDEFLGDKVRFLRTLLREGDKNLLMLKEEVELEPAARQLGQVHVRLLGPQGDVFMETPGMDRLLPSGLFPVAPGEESDPGAGLEVVIPGGRSFRVVTAAAAGGPFASPRAVIQVALDRTREEDLLASYRRALWLTLGTALVACAGIGYHIARRGLRPLAEITAAARRIHSATLHQRIATRGLPAELLVLATRFNEMLDRLQESFDRLARFAADIAHELRNPVNNFRGEMEVALRQPRSPEAYREVLSSCLEECGRLTHLIDSLLFVARAESPQAQIAREPLDVGQELRTVCDYYGAAAADAGVTLGLDASDSLVANLDRTLLHRAIGNLVANALAHTPAGGTVRLAAVRDGAGVVIEVTDSGHGIAADHLPHVFDRFYRADQARDRATGGVGLGLAIVRSITALHRGSASIASQVGKGTRVTLRFPGSE
jgi:two-component system heavy metal sensor histidine kinase CusS